MKRFLTVAVTVAAIAVGTATPADAASKCHHRHHAACHHKHTTETSDTPPATDNPPYWWLADGVW